MTTDELDVMYMQRCLQLARCGEEGAAPNPMVGAVVVCDGRIIGEGYHRKCGGPHAEVNAIASVRDPSMLQRSTLYVSLEPCAHYGKTPPCADLIVAKHIPRVVVGCQDPFARVDGLGIKKLRDAGVEVRVGVLEQECRRLNRAFITYHSLHRPWVTLKWAQSADGYIDRERGSDEPAARLSSAYTQVLVHRMRAHHMAIMVGTDTVIKDNPTLTNRLWPGTTPMRVTVDRHGRIPQDAHLLDESVPTRVYHSESVPDMLADLYQTGVQSVLVEGGRRLLESFLQSNLWDEVRVEESPVLLHGGVEAPAVEGLCLVKRTQVDGRWISLYGHRDL